MNNSVLTVLAKKYSLSEEIKEHPVAADTTYKGFDLDKSQVDKDENYLIYDKEAGKYLGEMLNEGQPISRYFCFTLSIGNRRSSRSFQSLF